MTRDQALTLVDEARERAECAKHEGRIEWTSADPDCPTHIWLAALVEEVGEVARCVHDGEPDGRLLEELAQLAGVAVGRMEALND